ncbi:hypothetical protein SAMN05519103_00331 [Rhizobiales bacterium GAS113]|nr:hypothetical protein SAMN05519103_00331 [Rhizobiales bacterium GAS113]
MSDLIKSLEKQAEAEDEQLWQAKRDRRQPSSFLSFADAAAQAIPLYARAMDTGEPIPERARDQRKAVDRLRMDFGIALSDFQGRLEGLAVGKEAQDSILRKALHDIERARPACESYIEQLLLPWLVFEDYAQITDLPVPIFLPRDDDMPPAAPLFIVPQFSFMRVRMDFALIVSSSSGLKIVDVECDGAAFHYEAKDAARDAYLAAFGIPTVRVTTKELRDFPKYCSKRAVRAISDLVG